jgi:hypothetical protein
LQITCLDNRKNKKTTLIRLFCIFDGAKIQKIHLPPGEGFDERPSASLSNLTTIKSPIQQHPQRLLCSHGSLFSLFFPAAPTQSPEPLKISEYI